MPRSPVSELAAPRATPASLKPLAGPWNALQVPIKTGGEDFGVREPPPCAEPGATRSTHHGVRKRRLP